MTSYRIARETPVKRLPAAKLVEGEHTVHVTLSISDYARETGQEFCCVMFQLRMTRAVVSCIVAGCCIAPSSGISAAEYDVTAYGAIANDGLDDTIAIRAALTAAQAGDVVLIPTGQWHLSASLRPKSGVTLAGAGRDATSLNYLGSTPGVFVEIASRNNLTVRDITLNGQNNPAVRQGISGDNGRGHQFHDLRIENLVSTSSQFGPHGIYFSAGVRESLIRDSEFSNMGIGSEWGGAIRMEHGSNGNLVLGNTIQNTGRGGIFANGSTGLTIQRNVVAGSGMSPDGEGLGIELWGGSHNSVVEDNQIDHWLSVDGSSHVAVRRNLVSDKSGVVKDFGLECAECVDAIFSSNTVDGGAHLGISVSNNDVKEHLYWAHNTITGAETWGAQIQGEAGGAVKQYFYNNTLQATESSPPNLYSDSGHGFRINGDARYLTFDSNRFVNNDRLGFQIGGANVDQLSFVNNTFTGNGAQAIRSGYGSSSAYPGNDLEWTGNVLAGNGGSGANTPFVAEGFTSDQKPQIVLRGPTHAVAGLSYDFSFDFADDGTIGHVLWDFDHGLPITQSSPSQTFPSPGNYRIGLVVWDDTGRAAHATMLLSVAIPGDFNVDGRVDADDYLTWRSEYGAGIGSPADSNGDGIVDAADYTVWRNHLGTGVPGQATELAPVPEPHCLALCSLAWCGVFISQLARIARINPEGPI